MRSELPNIFSNVRNKIKQNRGYKILYPNVYNKVVSFSGNDPTNILKLVNSTTFIRRNQQPNKITNYANINV